MCTFLVTKKNKKILFLVLVNVMSHVASAEPVVIRDYGGRDSGVPTLESMMEKNQQVPLKQQAFDEAARYPIRSMMRPGYLDQPQPLRTPQTGAQPFFMIGNDAFSRDWLDKNKAYLVKIGAQGLATNINSIAIFVELEKLADPLPLVAVPVDEIAETLNLQVYPVLVTGEEIAQ
jgi:integrating conjugative element protein (TIGR03765 family)